MTRRDLRVFAKARPGRIDARRPGEVAAPTQPHALDHWNPGIRAAGESGNNVITMYDVIGEDFWSGGGVTAKRVAAALRSIGERDVEVHLNSPGGDMFEGIAIYNMLREHPAKVTVKVLGLAASAASIVAMAGDEIQIGAASFLMIHNCWVMAVGNRFDMKETAEWLEPFDKAMADVYAARSGQDRAKVEEWMAAGGGDGTYFSGSQAVDLGFADAVLSADAMTESPEARADGRAKSDLLRAEIALCGKMPRTEARALLNKIKGKPDAALDTPKPDAGDLSWVGAAADLSSFLRS
ncbi:head maturation protease, ClpP-related [Roseomonas xinghualingensis]|uniref:head maturation protease, ClpP-related n=1 Tax=Roseomonas xinghualingensis TaxID=2986475 RepID=UPI0021F162D6|nr:head maturation protease, ClpP-related [Roseomonas sp. SXEYE001]MCV4209890.1 Clp protease ClpP [Roseomonas sp. SXEYE001]